MKKPGSIVCSLLLVQIVTHSAAQETIDFSSDVQPILARRCFQCHGAGEQEGGLRLDQRASAVALLESDSHAVVPGQPDQSELLKRIMSTDPDLRMPPEGKPLTEDEVKALRAWIAEGAEWGSHWGFTADQNVQPPAVRDQKWVQSPIDAFVLHRLETAGLQPAQPADGVALIRRAYYDLTGLPPSPDQVNAFLKDQSPDAFAKVVDQLLASPQYGEKWARHWLDLVRYADTNGYERDSRKDLIWKYRDYVIRAFNSDKPYDRFILEQLAGDELPDRTGDSITATGFYRLGIWDDEPADRELARYDYLDDILRTTGESFLGMTIGCARCHDHKIDPVAQKDYYSMLAFFADVSPHGGGGANHVPISTAADRAAFEKMVAAKKAREKDLADQILAIESDFLARLKKAHPELELKPARKPGAANGVVLADSRKDGQVWEYTIERPADHWFEIAFDDSKWKKGPGGFGTKGTPGSVVRTEWRTRDIWLRKDFRLEEIPGKLTLHIHHDEDAEVYLNGKQIASFRHYVGNYLTKDVTGAALDLLQTGRNTIAVHCRQTGGGQYIDVGLTGDFSQTGTIVLARKFGREVLGEQALSKWMMLRSDLTKSQAQNPEFRTEMAMAVAERGRNRMWILGRGSPAMKGKEVDPAFPGILSPPAADIPEGYGTGQTTGRRRRLAEWIASPANPMTARVMANRIWQHHFGRGLVRTTSDFGFQGQVPTHPKLLDWLAHEFTRQGWSMKSLHRAIMLSSSYQMSSEFNEVASQKDPTNNLFWRYNMRRLTAEEIRDSILSVSGELNLHMFGPGIYPPLPQEVLATSSRPGGAWGNSPPREAARRTIYIHVKRSLRPPMLAGFDVPDTDTPCAVRMQTTVPTQALGMLNSRFLNNQAQLFAKRLQETYPDDMAARIRLAIHLTAGRMADDQEVQDDAEFIAALQKEEGLDAESALQQYALMMLNTNEFVYLD